jgi:outer membrane beta-barrel protein
MMAKGRRKVRLASAFGSGRRWGWALGIALAQILSFAWPESSLLYAQESPNERFKNVEIRVIRPRFFNKAKKIELGVQFTSIMNESFIYTFLATGLVGYHFNESWAMEFAGAYGLNLDKEDKRVLFDEFGIKTKIFRTVYTAEANLQWTPIYGKWQTSSGRLIYFDTYLSVGGGMSGIEWKFSDFCTEPNADVATNAAPIPDDTTQTYPTFLFGLGQRYFVSKDTAWRWDIRNHSLMYQKEDSACDPAVEESGAGIHNNITLQFGASKFF